MLGLIGVRALLAVSPADLPRVSEHGAAGGIDWRVLAFTLGVCLITEILFGLSPAIGASRLDLNTALKESSNRSGTGFRQGKARALLMISETSLALVLLIGAALLIQTYLAQQKRNTEQWPLSHEEITSSIGLVDAIGRWLFAGVSPTTI